MSASLTHSGAASASSGRLARKALLRDINREQKKKDHTTLAQLRDRLRAARAAHREALAEAKKRCRGHRIAVSERLRAERARTHAEQIAKGEAERSAVRGACALDKESSEQSTRGKLKGARDALAAERAYQEDLKRIERGNRAQRRASPRASAAERRSESDDEVRHNIPEELVPLFNRVRRSIKGGPRETRTEAFLRYAEEHPAEYLESIDDRTEALIRDLERQQREAPRRRQNPTTRTEASNPSEVRALPAPDPRIASVELGELVAVLYRTPGGTTRRLAFKGTRPRLAYNASGLLVLGGGYRVGSQGIVG